MMDLLLINVEETPFFFNFPICDLRLELGFGLETRFGDLEEWPESERADGAGFVDRHGERGGIRQFGRGNQMRSRVFFNLNS